MKKTTQIFSILLIAAMLLSTFAITGFAAETAGTSYDGTPVTPTQISSSTYKSLGLAADKWLQYDGYYAIRNAAELYGFAELVNAGDAYAKAVLLDDIVVNSGTISDSGSSSGTTHYWYGIGGTEKENYFRGTFDGNGHYVSGIYYKEPEGQSVSYVGFFRVLAGATVKNLILKNSYFYAESDIGAIAGHVIGNTSYIDNCRIEEDVTVVKGTEGQEPYIGGIIGGNPLGGYMSTWPVYCRITDSVFLGVVQAMHADFTDGNSNRDFVGAISGASMRAGNAHKHVVLSNCFFKEGCVIDKNGNSKYKNGSSTFVFDTAMGGGYNGQGYWGTSAGATKIASASASHSPVVGEHKAIKEGDSDYKYCVICDKRIATITIDAPTTYVIPGASMQLTAKTEYSEVTSFSIASGTNYTASGMTFKTSVDALVGSEIKVKVTSAETTNVHAAEATITLKVGVVDSTAEIAKLQEELDNAIAELSAARMAEDDDLAAEIDALEKAMTNAQNAIATLQNNSATKAQLTALENTLKQADKEITAAYTKAINDAKSELKALIDATEEALRSAIDTNTGNIAALTADLVTKYNELIALIGQLPEGMESMSAYVESVRNTLDAAIQAVQKNLDDAIIALNQADAANAEALAEALETAKVALTAADEANKRELEEKLNTAQIYLQRAINQVAAKLAAAEQALNVAIAAGDKALDEKIAALNTALDNAIAASEAADENLQAALTTLIQETEATLQSAINKVAEDLSAAEQALNEAIAAGDKALDEKIAALNTALSNAIAAYKAADESLQTALTTLIQETQTTLQNAINKVADDLAAAEQAMNEAIATGDKELDEKIAALNTALNNAIAAYKAADENLQTTLVSLIQETQATLQNAINKVADDLSAAEQALNEAIAKVQQNLDEANAERLAQNQTMTAEMERMNTFIIVVCVIAGVAFCGCGTLAAFYIIEKKKK